MTKLGLRLYAGKLLRATPEDTGGRSTSTTSESTVTGGSEDGIGRERAILLFQGTRLAM